jgi:hypothetical protein
MSPTSKPCVNSASSCQFAWLLSRPILCIDDRCSRASENELYKSTVLAQQRSATFEKSVVVQLQTAWTSFESWASASRKSISDEWRSVKDIVDHVKPEAEWKHFSSLEGTILDPNTPLRDASSITYPGQNDPKVEVVKKVGGRSGALEDRSPWLTQMRLLPGYSQTEETMDKVRIRG